MLQRSRKGFGTLPAQEIKLSEDGKVKNMEQVCIRHCRGSLFVLFFTAEQIPALGQARQAKALCP
ncbi:hypothetical protein D770_20635 [Flammeovirgaceae bacterium 311]|nr:hypothetical protein D770_20635 [Flammeovirgaceae bacterium 311]